MHALPRRSTENTVVSEGVYSAHNHPFPARALSRSLTITTYRVGAPVADGRTSLNTMAPFGKLPPCGNRPFCRAPVAVALSNTRTTGACASDPFSLPSANSSASGKTRSRISGLNWTTDRGNHRLETFDQDGKYLESRYMNGRVSGFFIKGNLLYAIDSESGPLNHPNWRDGVRIGPLDKDRVTAFTKYPVK